MDITQLVIIIFIVIISIVLIVLSLAILSLMTRQGMGETNPNLILDEIVLTFMRYSTMKTVDKGGDLISKLMKGIFSKVGNVSLSLDKSKEKIINE